MVYWVFNEQQIERAIAEWLNERGMTVADAGEDVASLVLEFLHSRQMHQAELINGKQPYNV